MSSKTQRRRRAFLERRRRRELAEALREPWTSPCCGEEMPGWAPFCHCGRPRPRPR